MSCEKCPSCRAASRPEIPTGGHFAAKTFTEADVALLAKSMPTLRTPHSKPASGRSF
jgi:hypothetical protein